MPDVGQTLTVLAATTIGVDWGLEGGERTVLSLTNVETGIVIQKTFGPGELKHLAQTLEFMAEELEERQARAEEEARRQRWFPRKVG